MTGPRQRHPQDSLPWLLRLPGLRRFGAQLRQARAQLDALTLKLADLKARRIEERAVFAASVDAHKSRQLAPEALQQVLRARHAALVSASALHPPLTSQSAAYRTECTAPGVPADASRASFSGLTWVVPADRAAAGDLSHRLTHDRWLPFQDILATRELAVGTAMLDIGANVGTTSIPRVVLGDFQYVFAAEPDPANYACLVANVRANGLEGYVLPDRVAIGATDGTALLRRGAQIGTHHLVGAAERPGDFEVATIRLDSWVAARAIDVNAVTFVKVDTQGWEAHVLEGAPGLLARRHIAWQLEFSPSMLKRAGGSAEALLTRLERHFTHFIDLGATTRPRVRPIADIRNAVAYVERRERRYTNLLLYNGDAAP